MLEIVKWLFLVVLTVVPFVELRLSIPVGILSGSVPLFLDYSASGLGLNPLFVFIVACITNSLLGFAIYDGLTILGKRITRRRRKESNYRRFLNHAREQLSPYLKKFGIFGVALFIALPIPGSGVYIGSIGSQVLGVSRSDFRKACVLGVVMAASIVTIITLTGQSIWG